MSMAPDTLRELCLPSNPESASRARAEVRDWLGAEHPAYEPVRLAVSELVTNAFRHARHSVAGAHGPAASEPLVLRLSAYEDRLRVEVTDTGLATESPRLRTESAAERARTALAAERPRVRTEPAFLLAEGGRGLSIVDMLSDGQWDFCSNPEGPGWTLWCEIPADPPLHGEPLLDASAVPYLDEPLPEAFTSMASG
ncbi:MAG: signal transduction histidine kinase regulating citrate/malate metabolism [Sphaerisporangium sp.]|nr:signal transduction histidine kinase regulating citrate/malate metabolism [Sphaerisporangium sp.]